MCAPLHVVVYGLFNEVWWWGWVFDDRGGSLSERRVWGWRFHTAGGAVLVTTDHTLQACSRHIDVRQTANWADDVGVKP